MPRIHTPPRRPALPPDRPTTTAGTPYSAPWSVQDAVDAGHRAGEDGLFDTDWGDARRPSTPVVLEESVRVGERLVAIDHARDRAALVTRARQHQAQHAAQRIRAHAALERAERAEEERAHVRGLAAEAEQPEPTAASRRTRALLLAAEVALAAALAVPDVFLTAPALDRFGLLDEPLIGDLGWTDERHVAALAVVLSLLGLAHLLGRRLTVAAWRTGRALRVGRPSAAASRAVSPTRAAAPSAAVHHLESR